MRERSILETIAEHHLLFDDSKIELKVTVFIDDLKQEIKNQKSFVFSDLIEFQEILSKNFVFLFIKLYKSQTQLSIIIYLVNILIL